MKNVILNCKELTYKYEDSNIILEKVNIEANIGEIIGLNGESGCGKTTLGKILSGIIPKEKLSYKTFDILGRTTLMFQNSSEILNPNRSLKSVLYNKNISKYRDIKLNLDKLNLEYINENELIKNLSGGERQRIAFLLALLSKSEIIILDEPFSSQSILNMRLMSNYMKNLDISKKSIIIISHNLEFLSDICDKVYYFNTLSIGYSLQLL